MEDFTEKEIFMLSVMVNQMDYLLRVTNAVVAYGERISLDDLYDLACKLGVEKFMQ